MTFGVFVIDMLKEFVEGSIKASGINKIIPNIKKIIEKAHSKGYPVFYLCDAHEEGDSEFKVWGPHALKGTDGAKIIDQLTPSPEDIIIEKRTYTGFYNTFLDEKLKTLNVEKLILTGIHTHICVQHTAVDAFYRGFELFVVDDATSTINEKMHKQGIETMKTLYGAKILSTEEVLKLLE